MLLNSLLFFYSDKIAVLCNNIPYTFKEEI